MFDDSIDSVTATVDAYNSRGEVEFTLYENGTVGGESVGTFEAPEAGEHFKKSVRDNKSIPKEDFHAEMAEGGEITLLDARIGMKRQGFQWKNTQITQLHPRRLQIDSHNNEPLIGSSVTVEIDLLNAEYLPQPRSEPRDRPILERDSWQVNVEPVNNHRNRIDLIQERKQPVRTSKLIVEQHDNCPPRIHLQRALERIEPLMRLFAVLQGVLPAPIRASITTIDGRSPSWRCESWITDYRQSVGCAHTRHPFPNRSEARVLFNDGYETYLDELDEETFNRAISWYIDALIYGRTVDARMASLASGIEQLAEGHRARDKESGKTAHKIKNLIDKLGVEFEDLAEFSGTFTDDALDGSDPNRIPEYFYSKSRNFVLHGDEKVDSQELNLDYEATLWLFRRILVRQFIKAENYENLDTLSCLSPNRTNAGFTD